MPQSRASFERMRAMRRACASLSITHGPATSARGAPPPMARSWLISTRRVRPGPWSALGLPELPAGTDEAPEERVREHRLRLELRMELAGQEIRVIRNLHDFHEATIGRLPAHPQTPLHHGVEICPVYLVAMTVPFADLRLSIGVVGLRARLEDAGPLPEAHVASHAFHSLELAQLVDHRVRCGRVELRGVGVLEPADVAREFDHGALQSEADAEERDLALARVPDRLQHPGHAADPEPA